jgi:hypothetical protein
MAKKGKAGSKSKRPYEATSGESNTGLVVTMIFFIIATLTLGVFTYLGYSGQTEYAEKEKKASNDAKTARKELNEELTRRLVYSIGTGAEMPGDQAKLAQVKAPDAFTKAIEGLKVADPNFAWDANQERPRESFRETMQKIKKERDAAVADKKAAEASFAEAKAAYDALNKSLNDKLAKATEDLKKAQNDAVEGARKEREDYVKMLANLDTEVSEALKRERQKGADDQAAAERDKRKLQAEIEGLKKQLEVVRAQIAPPNSLEADTPKGKIMRIDREAGIAYINLGSADYIRPNLAFSVMPPSASGKTAASRERKGALEVTAVLEPHLSAARITDQSNPLRDPILVGDVIFNPSWNSGQRQHVALAGIFDLDGDGRDDIQEVIRNLERQGIIVDAWVDLRDRGIKGPGVTERTTYMVLGEMPQTPASVGRSGKPEDDPRFGAVRDIMEKVAELQTKAKDKGLQPVAYRRYLTLVGYPLPKFTGTIDRTSTTYMGLGSANRAATTEEEPK